MYFFKTMKMLIREDFGVDFPILRENEPW